jgi:hypothetical protein
MKNIKTSEDSITKINKVLAENVDSVIKDIKVAMFDCLAEKQKHAVQVQAIDEKLITLDKELASVYGEKAKMESADKRTKVSPKKKG